MAGKIVEWALRVLLAVTLAIAGAAKVFQPETFAIEIDRFQLTPWWLSLALGYFLPWLEVVTALALFLNRSTTSFGLNPCDASAFSSRGRS